MNAHPPPSPETANTVRLRWIGFVLLLAPLLTRATSSVSTLPGWDLDPTMYSIASPAIGPAGSMLIDALTMLGAAALFASEALARRRIHGGLLVLAAIGAALCLAHGWLLPSPDSPLITGSLATRRIATAWVAAVFAGLAVAHAARDPAFRRATLAVLLGFITLLCLRGAQQVFIEHPAMLAEFNADRERFLAAQGLSPDSPNARAYIRRATQPEATGWFGLSNVCASFAAFGVVAAVALVLAVLRRAGVRALRSPAGIATLAFAALALIGLWLGNSKGAYAATGLGLGLITLAPLLGRILTRRLPRRAGAIAGFLGVACVATVIALILIRGLIGERLGELSVLFRAFYIEAAARIFAAHPLKGVGPDGFQQAYLLAKNPLSPEEVTSPHSILFDWAATLGLAGLAWGVLFVLAAARLGRNLLTPPAPEPPSERPPSAPADRAAAKAAMLTLALGMLAATWVASPYIPLDAAVLRLIGLGLGLALAWRLVTDLFHDVSDRAVTVGLAAAALALAAHAQIEVTLSFWTSAGLAATALGLAARPRPAAPAHRPPGSPLLAAGALVCLAGFTAFAGAWPAHRWERHLHAAAGPAHRLASIRARLSTPEAGAQPARTSDVAAAFNDLAKDIGHPIARNPDGVSHALAELEEIHLAAAAAELRQAAGLFPADWRIAREEARLHLRIAVASLYPGDAPAADAAAAQALVSISPPGSSSGPTGYEPGPASSVWLRALAMVQETYGRERPNSLWLRDAAHTLARAFAIDPYNLEVALRLFRLHEALGNPDQARQWAAKALELDGLSRLDPTVRSMSEADRRDARAAQPGP